MTGDARPPRWTRSAAWTAGAVVAVVLGAAGLLLSRIDVALLALPLVVALAVVADRPPDPGAPVAGTLELDESIAAGDSELGFGCSVDAGPGVEAIVLRVTRLGADVRELVVPGPRAHDLRGRVAPLHSGPQELVRVELRLLGADAAAVGSVDEPLIAERVVTPRVATLDRLPLPRRLRGLTGPHESVRAGDGGDFRDVHPFTAGDRLRRIDWKATARRGRGAGDLYVRRTAALAEATVLIVLDSRDDVGEMVAQWSLNDAAAKGLSALDVAREAASSIASAGIRAGDRVGVQDLSSHRGLVAPGAGDRHLWRLLRTIERAHPVGVRFHHRRAPIVPSGAIVYLLSSLLDDQPVGLALRWRGGGHRVIAVDVLPAPRLAGTTPPQRVAHRILTMERADRLRTLRAGGVELLRWPRDPAGTSREARLAQLARPPRGGDGP